MSAADRSREPAWYEVTVVGPVGPVLRRALEPCRTGPAQLVTIARARVHADVDLVELTHRLCSHGSTVAGIRLLEGRGDPAAPPRSPVEGDPAVTIRVA